MDCTDCTTFSGFSVWGSEKYIFFILCAGVNPCHVGKTFAPQLWFVAGYCRGSGISLMKWFRYSCPLNHPPSARTHFHSTTCAHARAHTRRHTHTLTNTCTHRQSYLNTVLHKHIQMGSNGCSSKAQTWTQTHSSTKQVILENDIIRQVAHLQSDPAELPCERRYIQWMTSLCFYLLNHLLTLLASSSYGCMGERNLQSIIIFTYFGNALVVVASAVTCLVFMLCIYP